MVFHCSGGSLRIATTEGLKHLLVLSVRFLKSPGNTNYEPTNAGVMHLEIIQKLLQQTVTHLIDHYIVEGAANIRSAHQLAAIEGLLCFLQNTLNMIQLGIGK